MITLDYRPVSGVWEVLKEPDAAPIMQFGPEQIINSCFNALADVFILILPIATIRKLQLPRAKKSLYGPT